MPKNKLSTKCRKLRQQYLTLKELKAEFDYEYEQAFLSKKFDKALEIKKKLSQEVAGLRDKIFLKRVFAIYQDAGSGKENRINFELNEQLEYWRKFYQEHGVNWCELPEQITLSLKQAEKLQRLIKKFGFDYMMIIPDGLANTRGKFYDLHEAMTSLTGNGGYETKTIQDFEFARNSFRELTKKQQGFRIVLTKQVKELNEDKLFEATLGKSVHDLKASGGLFEKNGLSAMSLVEYLIMQRDFFEKNIDKNTEYERHLDCSCIVELLEDNFVRAEGVLHVYWHYDEGCLRITSAGFFTNKENRVGSRLSGYVEQ